mmetsp:Transcript_34703/g.75011  ORF Transcript_34703/g.75011 Transcript_34703/m.75011 type:complete len:521 (-) Transcript_34703:614-2176(-)
MPGTMSARGSYDHWGTSDPNPGPACNDTDCMCLEDYTRRLDDASSALLHPMATAFNHLLRVDGPVSVVSRGFPTPTWPTSPAPTAGQGSTYHFAVFNPLAHHRIGFVTLPLPTALVRRGPSVLLPNGTPIVAQLDEQETSLTFAIPLPPLGTITLSLVDDGGNSTTPSKVEHGVAGPLSNQHVDVDFSDNGRLHRLSNRHDQVTSDVFQDYMYYKNGEGGPYCLVLTGDAVAATEGDVEVRTLRGSVYNAVVQRWDDTLSQTVRLYHDAEREMIEVEHSLKTLPVGHEVVSRYSTDFPATLYTDDSGLEMHRREWRQTLPLSGNFHSLVQSIFVRQDAQGPQLSVLTRRTMAVSSAGHRGVEYMMQRRLNSSDDQGPWPLDDKDEIDTTVWLLYGQSNRSELSRMMTALELEHPPAVILLPHRPRVEEAIPIQPLPRNVHLLSLAEPPAHLDTRGVVLRLQNVLEGGPNISLHLDSIFSHAPPVAATLLSLTMQKRLAPIPSRQVILKPIEIVTVLVTFE